MRVTIDRDQYAAHGLCYIVHAERVHRRRGGYGRPALDGELARELVASARRAVGSCPEKADRITGEIEMARG